MARISIRGGRREDKAGFIGLVRALAEFEKLEPPSPSGRRRLVEDVFRKKRIRLFVAADGEKLVGYALYFFTYSSFLARQSLYLEDLFVLEDYRKRGVGGALFRRCVREAVSRRCGRMEWAVLTWNEKAITFYERLGAKRLSDWHVYRLDERALSKVLKAGA
ncbi:MAG TPA: GNAT family N-acetyltransferase [Nitrososphaerales archaeon]|nr:GNAT family N-acetyltransferase [Nitrososphaerales archaeon]